MVSIGYNYENTKSRISTADKYANICTNQHNKLHVNCNSIHAEDMAISKLPPTKKRTKISLIVIRISACSTSSNYRLTESKPCLACYNKISNIYGYRIKNIYWSDMNGLIIKRSYRDFLSDTFTLSKYYRMSNVPKYLVNND